MCFEGLKSCHQQDCAKAKFVTDTLESHLFITKQAKLIKINNSFPTYTLANMNQKNRYNSFDHNPKNKNSFFLVLLT